MTRKSKQAGGNFPLTYSERQKLTAYGTQTSRLTSDSHLPFGDCCLQNSPAIDPVVTPRYVSCFTTRMNMLPYQMIKNTKYSKDTVKVSTTVRAFVY